MRIVLASDAHGDLTALSKMLDALPPVDACCYLGDYWSDGEFLRDRLAEQQPGARFYMVPGNNDWQVPAVRSQCIDFPVGRALLTHGHAFRVKQTYDLLAEHAQQAGALVAFFGHTHLPYSGWHGGVLLLNPGAVYGRQGHGSYALLDWTHEGPLPRIHPIL